MLIHPTALIHPLAFVCGDVSLGARVFVLPYVAIRGDTESIEIGDDSNVQDGTVVHTDFGFPTRVGKRVGIGHRAIIHGSTVEDNALIGMGAILLNGTRVGSGSIVAAGAVCREGMQIPPNSLVVGVPGKIIRETTDAERARIDGTVATYLKLGERHRRGEFPAFGAGISYRPEVRGQRSTG